MMNKFYDLPTLIHFLEGKSAVLVLTSEKTEQSFTYRFKIPKMPSGEDGMRFVEYRGSDGRWFYLGNYNPTTKRFFTTRKTTIFMKDHPARTGMSWFIDKIRETGELPDRIRAHHEGKCSMCGRQLTDPVSIKRGIGPECIRKQLRHEPQLKFVS